MAIIVKVERDRPQPEAMIAKRESPWEVAFRGITLTIVLTRHLFSQPAQPLGAQKK
jgi:hypothetical protein